VNNILIGDNMDLNFLKYYFEHELFLQNRPMSMNRFIDYCSDRGIKINDHILEDFEKKGWFYPIFRVTNIKNFYSGEFSSLYFDEYSKEDFIKLIDEGYIFLPQNNEFKEFKEFKDDETQSLKTYSYYSSFQILKLIKILNEGEILDSYMSYLDDFIDLLIAIQIYSPYGRSNQRLISLNTEKDIFYEKLAEYDLDEVLKVIGIDSDCLYKAYANICSRLNNFLGSDNIIQLWKNISWSEKKKCKGTIRLGIEYLQWALMLKRCIEDYLEHLTFDVDEVDRDWKKVRDINPSKETGRKLRAFRNDRYMNKMTDDYEFILNRKKLYYLSNRLTLDYHPRVIIFVEGDTEEVMIPKFFEFYGYNFQDLGFEIVNVESITKFYSGNIKKDKVDKLVVSNFRSLITFNLELWQAIPFFVGDNENDFSEMVKKGIIFDTKRLIKQFDKRSFRKVENEIRKEHGDLNTSMINDWSFTWEHDFELSNYNAEELKEAINDVCHTNFSLKDIQDIYDSCINGNKKGISSLNKKKIKRHKIEINKKAFENLVKKYDETKDSKISERPIFKLIEKLLNIHRLNHQPVDTEHALNNKKELFTSILIGKNVFQDFDSKR
jgi:hypothetical protein